MTPPDEPDPRRMAAEGARLMRDAERRALVKVRTLVGLFMAAMADAVDGPSALADTIRMCGTAVTGGAVPEPELAGALHLALDPHRRMVDGGDGRALAAALARAAVHPLRPLLGPDADAVLRFCDDPVNHDALCKWARKLLRATDAALASSTETETPTDG